MRLRLGPDDEVFAFVRRIAGDLIRGWRVIAGCAVLGGLVASAMFLMLRAAPSSSTTVFVAPLTASPFSPDPRGQSLTNLETESRVVVSDEVLTRAAETLPGDETAAELAPHVDVSIPKGSQVLEVTFTEAPGVPAVDGVAAVAQAYLDVRRERAVASIQEQLAAIESAEKVAKSQLSEAARQIRDSAAGSASELSAREALTVASGTLAALGEQRSQIVSAPTSPGEVLSTPSTPAQSSVLKSAIAGFGAGILLGVGLVIWRTVRTGVVAGSPETADPVEGASEGDGPQIGAGPATTDSERSEPPR